MTKDRQKICIFLCVLRWDVVQSDGRTRLLRLLTDGCLPLTRSPLCVGVQVYESKLQELQKQVETISLVAETPDEEELEEEEEEEGAYGEKKTKNKSLLLQMQYC